MPRKAKTMTGKKAQPIGPVSGQEYGRGVDQMTLQRQLPAPQEPTVPAGVAPPAPAGAPPAPAPPVDLMEIARRMQGRAGLMRQPTARPNEPVTAGLRSGPGPGPEALSMPQGNPILDQWRRLSVETGDPYFAELAAKLMPR